MDRRREEEGNVHCRRSQDPSDKAAELDAVTVALLGWEAGDGEALFFDAEVGDFCGFGEVGECELCDVNHFILT